MFEQDNSVIAESTRQQISTLSDTADEAYSDDQLLRAAELYGRAAELADLIGDFHSLVRLRSWQGVCLVQAGKYQKALAVFGPILQSIPKSADIADVYRILIRNLEVAAFIPVSLTTLEKALAQVETFLRDSGELKLRHRLLYLHAGILADRGLYKEALQLAQEAWISWRGTHPSLYASDAHLNQLVSLSINVRDSVLAHKYLAEWESLDTNIPRVRSYFIPERRSELARLEGQFDDAVNYARNAVVAAEQAESNEGLAIETLVRAFLCCGETDRAADIIGRRFAYRHSECGETRFNVHLLWGDYHLACARRSIGLNPVDDELLDESIEVPAIPNVGDAGRHLLKARRSYESALKTGTWIDRQLQCDVREKTIRSRYARMSNSAG